MNDQTLRFGANYVPSKNWFYSWVDPDFEAIEADFQAISSIGVDHIRMHLRWDLFQPNETYISDEMICRLKKILDLAEKYFSGLVDAAVGDRPGVVERKPAPDTVWAAMRELGGVPERSVYVGDSEVDRATAEKALEESRKALEEMATRREAALNREANQE